MAIRAWHSRTLSPRYTELEYGIRKAHFRHVVEQVSYPNTFEGFYKKIGFFPFNNFVAISLWSQQTANYEKEKLIRNDENIAH